MHTTTSLPADDQLDQLVGQFAHWRQTRAHPGERIPPHLWEQAAVLAQVVPYSRVAQHVRVSPSDLKKHMAARPDSPPPAPAIPPPFVEVPAVPAWPPATAALESELERPDGVRLRLRCPKATAPVAAVIQAFVEGGR
jgi:hypothetical protein